MSTSGLSARAYASSGSNDISDVSTGQKYAFPREKAFTTIRGAFCNNSLSCETRQLVQVNKTEQLPSLVTQAIFIIPSLRPQSAFQFKDMGRYDAPALEWEHAFSREILIRMNHFAIEDSSTVNK